MQRWSWVGFNEQSKEARQTPTQSKRDLKTQPFIHIQHMAYLNGSKVTLCHKIDKAETEITWLVLKGLSYAVSPWPDECVLSAQSS